MSIKHKLTLNDIPVGTRFMLVRTGEKYIKGDKYYYDSKPKTRSHVERSDGHKSDLSIHCYVKLLITAKLH